MSWGNTYPSKLVFRKRSGLWVSPLQYNSSYFDPKTLTARTGFRTDSFTFLKTVNGRLLLTQAPCSYYASAVADLLKGKHKVTWVYPNCSLDLFKTEGLKTRFEELYRLQAELNKKGIRQKTKAWHASRIKDLEKEIKDLTKLGAGFPVKARKAIQRAELDRVEKENAAYTEARIKARALPKSERDPVAIFKEELLQNSFRS